MRNRMALWTGIMILLTAGQVFAQSNEKITGSVTGADQKPASAATVELHLTRDSALVKVALTSNTGAFEFSNIKSGKYFVAVSAIGHATFMSKSFDYKEQESIKLDPVKLEMSAASSLKEVRITTKKPLVEQKLDKTVLNVDASIGNAGNTVMEVLEKAPGVTVDKDGKVSLRGKQGVLIMIDGRPTYMSESDLANYLRSLPSSAVETIELMTNPPAKYDAAGNAGVINIRTKKNKALGFNGSVSANYGQGVYAKTNESINLNYRIKKFNFFANYNYNLWTGFNDLYLNRSFFTQGTKEIQTIFEQNSFMKNVYPSHSIKAGVDFYATKRTTLGMVWTGYYENGQETGENTAYIQNSSHVVTSIVDATLSHKSNYQNGGLNLNMRHQFDSTGKELNVDLDYINYDINSHQLFHNKFYNPDWETSRPDEIIKGELPAMIRIYSGKADYSMPLKHGAKLDLGVKSSYVKSDNDAQYFLGDGGAFVVDSGRTNHFLYKENINAVYANYSQQWKKWSLQAGLRVENTNATGKQYINDSSFKRNYTNLFPTVFLSYTLNDKNQFGLNFGRRIERPAYQDLNPFRYFLDPYTYQIGNPFLQPQFSYNVELSHTYKSLLTTTLNYTKTSNIITETLNQIDKDTVTYVYKENIANAQNIGIAFSLNMPVTKWWTTSVYVNPYYANYDGMLNGKPFKADAFSAQFNTNNEFKLGKGWSTEMGGWARTAGVEGQIVYHPMGSLNAGVQKKLLHDQATVKFSVSDIFYTQQFSGRFVFDNIDVQVRNQHDSRVARITFTYRFGKSTASARQRSTGADDEKNRVKGGSNN